MSSRTSLVPPKAHSVKDLLARGAPGLTRITDQAARQAARQSFWSGWLSAHLPAQIFARISGVSEHDGMLVIFAETAAWSARLRYAVLELEPDIRAADSAVSAIEVRVRPLKRS